VNNQPLRELSLPVRSARLARTALIPALLLAGHASALTLPGTDCTKADSARCHFSASASRSGTTGTGLPFMLGGFVTLGSGFVDAAENALYLPVEFGGQQDNQGVVMKVDLASGNRTVISGYDGEQNHGRGVAYTSDRGYASEAYDLGRVMVVRPGPGGSLLALVDKGLQSRTELIRIDKRTGDRTLVWASKVFADAAPSGPAAIRDIEKNRFNMGSNALCSGGDRTALKPASVFEADAQNMYLFMVGNPSGSGTGLVKVPLSGGSCTWVSQFFVDGSSPIGSGPTINTLSPLVFGSALIGNDFVAATGPNPNGNTVFAVDVRSGARRTVSANNVQTPARNVGQGDPAGYLGTLAAGPAGIATARPAADSGYFQPVLVNPQGGARTTLNARAGSLKDGRDSNWNVVAAIPGSSLFIVAFGTALHIWDSKTGNSYLLSQ